MSKKLVCVRDKKTEVFGVPVLVINEAEGKRLFEDLLSNSDTVHHNHPADFDLYCLGEYDEVSGAIYPSCSLLSSGDSFANKG